MEMVDRCACLQHQPIDSSTPLQEIPSTTQNPGPQQKGVGAFDTLTFMSSDYIK